MKKTQPAKESWGTAFQAMLAAIFVLVVIASLAILAIQVILFVLSVNPWILAALGVPATLVLIFRYTSLLKFIDEKWK